MFLSHKYKFLYIRTRRTGSQTFLSMTLPYFSEEHGDIHLLKNPPKPKKEFYTVQTLLDLNIINKDILKNYFIFTFERDMISKTISHYYQSYPMFGCCFSCYLKRGEFPIDTPYYTLPDTGKSVLDYTARFENFDKEIKFLWNKLFKNNPPKVYPHIGKTKDTMGLKFLKELHNDTKRYNI